MRDDVRRAESLLPTMRELLAAVSLVADCRAHGVDLVLDPDSDLGLRVCDIAHVVRRPWDDERVERLATEIRSLAPELRQVLQPSRVRVALNQATLAEHLGTWLPHALLGPAAKDFEIWRVKQCVRQAVREFTQQVASGAIKTKIRKVRKRPVLHWVDADTLTSLLKEGPRLG